MSIVHSQLAIYGAIDELVIEARTGGKGSNHRDVLDAAAKLLPNTTGFGEAGWSRELTQFINRAGIRNADSTEPLTFPTLTDATAELIAVPPPVAEPDVAPSGNPDDADGFEDQSFYNSAYDPVLARAGYGAFVLLKLGQLAHWDRLDEVSADLRAVLGVAVRSFNPTADEASIDAATESIVADLGTVGTRRAWTMMVGSKVGERFAADSKPCFGTLEEVDGKYCSTVVTDSFAANLSVADIEEIVDPVNWNLCSKFFCKMMQNQPNRTTGSWSRVREEISAECDKYRLATDLIFYKVRQKDGSIFINYDIDPQRTDRGYVEVDNGYIFISPDVPNQPHTKGVRIRTSKREHVNGLSPCATAALACLMGWADAGREMLAGTAQKIIEAKQNGQPVPKLKKFYPSTDADPGELK